MIRSSFYKGLLLIVLAIVLIVLTINISPLSQRTGYHMLADTRSLWGIPNAQNILSNVFFIIIGLLALFTLFHPARRLAIDFIEPRDRRFYIVFFIGVFLAGWGSSYYHWKLGNGPLIEDRIPIVIATMSLLTAILAERVSLRAANILLLPLLVFGVLSILYWYYSGNIAPYALMQVYPPIAIVLSLLMYQSPYTGTRYLWLSLVCYVIGRLVEQYDRPIYVLTHHMVGGHALKHVLMALSAFFVYWYLQKRRRVITKPDSMI